MYLMMDHNEEQYIKFLKRIHRFKCHWIFCCCCRFMVDEQLNQLLEFEEITIEIVNTAPTSCVDMDDIDTRDNSLPNFGSKLRANVNPFEFSAPTIEIEEGPNMRC